jgi:hypothetical protein
MGPGYVPLALGLVLAALGAVIVAKAYVAPDLAPGAVSDATPSDAPPSDAAVSDAAVSDAAVSDAPPSATPPSDRAKPDPDAPDPRPLAGIQWRPTVAIFAAVGFFALTVDGLGLLPATFGTGLLAAMARSGTRPLRALVIAVGLTLASWIIFVVLLQLRLALFGDWLGG